MGKPSVNTNPVANQYAGPAERIIEFASGEPGGPGGLIAFERRDDGALIVSPYRLDEGVTILPATRPTSAATTAAGLDPSGTHTWEDVARALLAMMREPIPAGPCGSTKSGRHVMSDDRVCEACGEEYDVE